MNLVLRRWDGVPCCGLCGLCGLCASSLTINFHIIQIISVSHLQHPLSLFLGCVPCRTEHKQRTVHGEDQLCIACIFRPIVHLSGDDYIIGEYQFFVFLGLHPSCEAVTPSCSTLGTFQWKTVELSIQLSGGCNCTQCQSRSQSYISCTLLAKYVFLDKSFTSALVC